MTEHWAGLAALILGAFLLSTIPLSRDHNRLQDPVLGVSYTDTMFAWVRRHTYCHLEAGCGLCLSDEPVSEYRRRKTQPPVIDIGTMALLESQQLPLVTAAIERLEAQGVVFSSGQVEQFDAVIWATGFTNSEQLSRWRPFSANWSKLELPLLCRND